MISRLSAWVFLISTMLFSNNSLAENNNFTLEQAELRAQLSPVRHAKISAEMTGKIAKFNVREGQHVNKGDILIKFDCALQKAQKEKALAELDAAKNTLVGQQRMKEYNAIGSVQLQNSELDVRKAKADIAYLDATLERCLIKAPYSGSISEQLAYENEFTQVGTPLLEIQDDNKLLLEFIVPSRWLNWLKPGFDFTVRIEDTGNSYPVKLSYVAAKVDAMSQSIKAVARINGNFPELLPGMSGNIKLVPKTISEQ